MAILYDAKSTSGEQTTDNSYSWNHTVGSDDNRLLVVGVLIRDGTEGMGISSLTFNGDPLTESAV